MASKQRNKYPWIFHYIPDGHCVFISFVFSCQHKDVFEKFAH